jgi:hypothetical protein
MMRLEFICTMYLFLPVLNGPVLIGTNMHTPYLQSIASTDRQNSH